MNTERDSERLRALRALRLREACAQTREERGRRTNDVSHASPSGARRTGRPDANGPCAPLSFQTPALFSPNTTVHCPSGRRFHFSSSQKNVPGVQKRTDIPPGAKKTKEHEGEKGKAILSPARARQGLQFYQHQVASPPTFTPSYVQ
jgi:hypothetical protein